MDNLDFINDCVLGPSTATLKAVLPSGQVCHISDNINPYRFVDKCPLLFHAFESRNHGRLQACFDVPSKTAIVLLLRYCYTGDFLDSSAQLGHISLLLHVHLYDMAVDFDIPELQLLTHGSFACQMETAACLPHRPEDLLDTIRFIYEHFADAVSRHQHGLVNILCNYCIATYMHHELGVDKDFLEVVSEIPAFHQDLCRTNMERNFADDCANAIVCLPAGRTVAHPSSTTNALSSRDLPDEMLYDVQPEPQPDNELVDDSANLSALAYLVHRPRIRQPAAGTYSDLDSASDQDGFVMMYRPKVATVATPDQPAASSPESVPSMKVDIRTATGSEDLSDDDWSMV